MEKVTKKRLQIQPPFDIRFVAIPTTWQSRTDRFSGEPCLVPAVNQHIERRLSPVAGPDELRARFFRLDINERTAIEFLNEVGVWSVIAGPTVEGSGGVLLSGVSPVGVHEMKLFGAFGFRWIDGRASIETVESLQAEQKHWRELMGNRSRLQAAFRAPPPSSETPHRKAEFALDAAFQNTLPLHLEWKGKHARAVVQPCTVRELLTALAWLDLVTGAKVKVCRNCDCEYTRGKTFYCGERCGSSYRQRLWRSGRSKRKPT